MEAEVLDSRFNQRVFAIVDTQEGSRANISAGLTKLGNAREVMDKWIERFITNLKAGG